MTGYTIIAIAELFFHYIYLQVDQVLVIHAIYFIFFYVSRLILNLRQMAVMDWSTTLLLTWLSRYSAHIPWVSLLSSNNQIVSDSVNQQLLAMIFFLDVTAND